MSQKKFIIALASLMLLAGGFVFVSMTGGGQEESSKASPETAAKVNSKVSHKLRVKETNRFTHLTDNSIRWQVRVDQLRRLDATTLNLTEINYLYTLLRQPPKGLNEEAWWVVVNEVMEQIVKQGIALERISSEFCSIIKDKSLDQVVRDYAVQHISNYVSQDVTATPSSHLDVIQTLVEVIQDPANQRNSIPGTTFMGLIEISHNESQLEAVKASYNELEDYLMPLIAGESSSASLVTRTSAINAVGLMQAEQYLPVLTELVGSYTTNDSVQLSSIAALGDFFRSDTEQNNNLEEVETLLQTISTGKTKFRYAATAALRKRSNK